MARVRAVMRRVSQAETRSTRQEAVTSGDLQVDFEHRRVNVKGQPVKLTPTEYSLLEQLVSRPDTVLTHRELLSNVWGADYRDGTEYLRVYIGRLRRKLEDDPANPRFLLTEPGVGCRFVPQL